MDENFEPKNKTFILTKFLTNQSKLEYNVGAPYYAAPETFIDGYDPYGFPVDVYSYAILLYSMFTNEVIFDDLKRVNSSQHYLIKIRNGKRLKKREKIPNHYWELIQRCWQQNPEDRPTFEEIVNILKNDKYALEEFGMKTDLEQLHEYQRRIDFD